MGEDPIRLAAEAAIAAEQAKARDRVESLERMDVDVTANAARASDAFWKLAGKKHDAPLSPKAEVARRDMLASMGRVESVGRALEDARSRLQRLEDPLLVEQWIREQRRRPEQGRDTTTTRAAGIRGSASREARSMAAEEARSQAVKALKDANGDFSAAAKALNDSKVQTASGKPWTPRRVKVVTSQAGVEHPKAERVKKEPATPRAPAKKTNGGNGDNVVPIDKKTQAAGTSRGGTGSRKKTSATTQASSASGGQRRRGRNKK